MEEFEGEIICAIFSCSTCFILQYVILPLLPSIFPKYRTLYSEVDEKHRFEWNTRIVCTIHAVFVFIVSLLTLFRFPEFWKDNDIYFTRYEVNYMMSCSFGYFFYDFVLLCIDPKNYRTNLIFFVHHLVALTSEFYIVYYDGFHIGALLGGLLEFVNPNAHIVFFLRNSGNRETTLYTINGVVLLLGWIVFRWAIGLFFFGYFFLYLRVNELIEKEGKLGYGFFFLMYFFVSLMNGYWGYKIFSGIIKIVFTKKKKVE